VLTCGAFYCSFLPWLLSSLLGVNNDMWGVTPHICMSGNYVIFIA
jgi:hypothetical protein